MMTSTSRLSLRGLRTFCLAARHESFRAAADELFITASAVSHQIKSLEQELGQQLFDRKSRSLSLTTVGKAMFEEACPLMTELDEVATRYRQRPRRRSINISVQPFFASELFVPRLKEFLQAHPDLDLSVDTSDESSEKLPETADVGIRLFRSPPAGAELLLPLALVPVGSQDFKRDMKVSQKSIVSRFPIVVHETRPTAWQQWSRLTGINLPRDSNAIRLDSMIAVATAAQKGMGAALIPGALGKRWFDDGSLVRLFDEELRSDDGYYLISKKDKADSEDVRCVRDWVLQSFNGQ
ncbi:MAG: LysR substrate-binding domain-containing protein [Pseudomonadota bacterium]